jgi:hypothetical protein
VGGHSWLRHCATSWNVAGLIPDGVTGIFHWHNPPSRTRAPGLTQPLTEMSTRNISWEVKTAGVYGWQPYHLHMPAVLKSGSFNLLEPSWPVQACNGIAIVSGIDRHSWTQCTRLSIVIFFAKCAYESTEYNFNTINKTQVPCHGSRQLDVAFSPWRHRFDPWPLHLGSVVDKVAMWQVLLWVFPLLLFHSYSILIQSSITNTV